MKKIIMCCALSIAASIGAAATFSAGGGAGTSVIDANGTGDYTSLDEASQDFRNFSGGSTGDWILLIRSDLTETTPTIFANTTNGFSVTVKPDTGTSPTITYQYSDRPVNGTTRLDGAFLVGPPFNSINGAYLDYPDMQNFTLDGWNGDSSTPERNLTFYIPAPADTSTEIPRDIIRFAGKPSHCEVKNCTLFSDSPGGTGLNCCVEFTARGYSAASGGALFNPDFCSVSNCGLYASKGDAGRGVMCRFIAGSPVAGAGAMHGITVENCDIAVSFQGVAFSFNAGGSILNNNISIHQEIHGATTYRPEAIIHDGSNQVAEDWTMDIIGNHISQIHSLASQAIQYAIGVGGGVSTSDGATNHPVSNVINNMVGGYDYEYDPITSPNAWLCRGLVILDEHSPGTFNIKFNSISMADQPNLGPGNIPDDDSTNRLACLSMFNAGGFEGTLNFTNNIVNYLQHDGTFISTRPGKDPLGGTLNFESNTYNIANGARFGDIDGTIYETLADWQSNTGRDTGSNSIDPFAPSSGGHWISDSDQHFSAAPDSSFLGTTDAAVPTDIDGDARANPPTRGADEFFTPPSAVSDWAMY